LLPALRRANPKAIAVLSRTAELIAADQDALDELAVGFLNQARIESKWGIAGENEAARRERIEAPAYSVSAFLARPLALRRRMIIEALRRFKAGTMLGDGETGLAEIGFSHIAAVEGLLGDGCSGKRIQLPGRIEVWREFDELVFKRTGAAQGPGESRIDEIDSAASAGGLRIELERSVSGGLLETLIEETRLEARRRGRDWLTAVLDDDRLPKTLIVRTRRAGETAWVLGQRQTKKLKNLMIEHRIPTSRRATWPVVATPEGQYVWSPGLPPANDFAANDETHGLAILRALGI
jgi:tRNA(Ile)-lysidine synthase